MKSPRVDMNAPESHTLDCDELAPIRGLPRRTPPKAMIRHELGPERLQVSELQARVTELEEELAGARTTEVSDDHGVVAQPGLEDIRNAYAETLLRLPRSERLKEMRALAEKALGIGMVESRRRKPRATEAAAQTTEVEPASEFHVEREGEPEEATPDHQNDATIVSDTIHTPGVKVANIKRRRRKPEATEPAGDGN
jgi:hypothetical protein